ncbi:MAG: hypothetical protein GY851_18440 [bacterium]|nr:hypothetical protein [bacterium]
MGRARLVVWVALTCVLLGGSIGALTNMVNGAVSPLYFKNIMRWHDVENIWRASVAQGVFEGLIYGILFAAVFATVVGIVTKGDCPYSRVARFLGSISLAILTCWAAGGMVAMGLAMLSPEFYQRAFIGVPEDLGPMLRYAWVGGSIWGGMLGGVLSAILGSVVFRSKWREEATSNGANPTPRPALDEFA